MSFFTFFTFFAYWKIYFFTLSHGFLKRITGTVSFWDSGNTVKILLLGNTKSANHTPVNIETSIATYLNCKVRGVRLVFTPCWTNLHPRYPLKYRMCTTVPHTVNVHLNSSSMDASTLQWGDNWCSQCTAKQSTFRQQVIRQHATNVQSSRCRLLYDDFWIVFLITSTRLRSYFHFLNYAKHYYTLHLMYVVTGVSMFTGFVSSRDEIFTVLPGTLL